MERAANANQKSRQLDFKSRFEDTNECWCGLVKDVVAMANSGGGILVFGANSDGTPSGFDCKALLTCDMATITSKVFKWTGYEFAELETTTVKRANNEYPALIVGEADAPIPFTKPGEWETAEKKKKTEFAEGTVYFRHGAKSSPGVRADFVKWIENYASRERKRLMTGVKKLAAAPPGHIVAAVVTAPTFAAHGSTGIAAQLSNDPGAMKIIPRRAADFHPHRGKELREAVNRAVRNQTLNAHDVTSINLAYNVFVDHPEFATRPHDKSSPLYSNQYAEWIAQQMTVNPNFLRDARNQYAERQRAKGISYAHKRRKRGQG